MAPSGNWPITRLVVAPMTEQSLFKRTVFFVGVTLAGYIANNMALQLSDVTPLLLGLIAPMLLLLRLGFLVGLISLLVVLLPLAPGPLWVLAAAQFFLLWPARRFHSLSLVLVSGAYLLLAIGVLDYTSPYQDPMYLSFSALLYCINFLLNCAGSKMLFDVTAARTERRRQTLQHQLASRIAIYSAVPASFLTMMALFGATVLDLSKNNAKHLQLNQHVSSELTSQLTGYIKQLELTRQHLDKVPQDELLRELVKSNPAFISALRTDAQGIVQGFYKEFIAADIRNSSVAHREYFSVPKATLKPMVSNIFQGQQLGHDLLFAVAVPLFSNEQFAGVLEVSVSLERLTSQFPAPHPSSNYQFLLLDGSQLKLWGQDQLQTPLGQFVNLEANELVSKFQLFSRSWFNPVHSVQLSENGEHMLQKTAISQTNWQLLQYSEMASLYFRYDLFLAVAQLGLAFLVILMRYSSRQFVSGYTETLGHVIHSLERLEPDQEHVASMGHRATAIEFDELQSSFDRMQRRIAQAHRQLQQVLLEKTQLSDELEQRVQTRTRELASERDKANELAAIKSRFLANMSHELRTPLSIIQGYASQMQAETLPPAAQAELKAIREHSMFLLHIVNDILDTAKIDEGKLRLDPQPINLPELLQELAATLQLLTRNKDLVADLQIAVNLPAVVITDSFRLRQIVMNLMSNAVKFTEHGFVRLSASYQAPNLVIAVTDSGTGISLEQQQRIFQAFEQADVSTTRQFGGTGLGLYISQRLAEMLDARLTLQSEIGQGSCFTLEMPITLANAAVIEHAELPSAQVPELPNRVILIVDDVSELRQLFQSMLKGSGASIVQAANGDDALAEIAKQPIDLLLLDMHMPVRDGLSTLKTLRQQGYTMPVIALTADVQLHKHQEILDAGGQQVLTKPVDATNLISAIQGVLGKPSTTEVIDSSAQTAGILLTQSPNTEPVPNDTGWDDLQLSFVESLPPQLTQLQQADNELMHQLLHKLKGTAACLDFGTLSQLALLAETQLKEHQECAHELIALTDHINELIQKLPTKET